MTTTGGNTNCTTNCIFGGTTAQSTLQNPVFTMPTAAVRSFFMRLTVTDQFGGATTVNFNINRPAEHRPDGRPRPVPRSSNQSTPVSS